MKDVNSIAQTGELNRRKFLAATGKGIIAATVISGLPGGEVSAQSASGSGAAKSMSEVISIKLPPLEQPSEKKQEVSSTSLPKDKRIGYAIVGLGNLSLGQILPAFGACKYAKPVALVSGNADKAQKIAAQYGIPSKNIYNYANFDQIRNNPEIDAVYIVLPNSMHEEFVVRAAKAGKHVLCEKPMAPSAKACQNMIDACKKAGKKLMIAYRIQYEPHNRLVMQWARNKHFGKVKLMEAMNSQNIGDPTQWRLKRAIAGGGSLPDIGLYCLNTCRFVLGEEPHTVIASQYTTPGDERFKEVEETVMWQMHFPSGAVANCSTSYGVHQARRYRCYADNGGWFGMDPAFDYERLQMEASQAQGKLEVKHNPVIKEKKQFALEMDHFSECIIENKEPFTPGEEGLQDQKIMEAIYESARTGKPVQLARIDKLDAFRGTPPTEEN
jgi:predicted dehydrogenase